MGQSASTDNPVGKKIVASKLETSSKTGVLNISGQALTSASKTWMELSSTAMIEKLRSIDISGNSLKTIPVEIFALVNVKTIKASQCKLHTIYDLTASTKLSHLKLDHNEITAEAVGSLPSSISHCNMSNNRLERIPAAFMSLTGLTELELNANHITCLSGIGQLTSLRVLMLDDNSIVEIPVELSLLVRLRRLSLRNNRLAKQAITFDGQSIPSEVFLHTSLDSMDLHGNTDLKNVDLFKFNGVDVYLERRKLVQDKALSGGALSDSLVFGLS
jgi:Leucine-rich repeat (LRR) protein